MDPEVEALHIQLAKILYKMKDPIRNGATAGTLGFRRVDEQQYVLICNELRKHGALNPLKRKYRKF